MIAVAKRALLPALVLGLLAFPGAAMAAHPHDSYTTATTLELDEPQLIDNTGAGPVNASDPSPEPLAFNGAGYCNAREYDPDSGVDMTHTIWGRVTGDGYPITIDTRGSAIDTVVAVYDGVPSASTFVACDNDIRPGTIRTTEVVFNTDPGVTYYVQAGCLRGCPAPQDDIRLAAWSSPPGDFRFEALPLRAGQPTPGFTIGATEQTGENLVCDELDFSRTVWLTYNATGTGTATFSAGGTFDSMIAVYRGASNTPIDCSDDPSTTTVRVTPGTYQVQVSAYGISPDAALGSFNATVSFTPDPAPPPDRDRDGVIDGLDKCPDVSGAARDANRDGCLDPDPDPDKDGVPVGSDKCPTQNSAARDRNRDGCLDKLPLRRVSGDAQYKATPTGNGVRFRYFRVVAPRGAKITIRCGPRCRFTRKASAGGSPLAKVAKTVTIRQLAGRSFRAGQKIRVYVTRKGRIGTYVQVAVRRGDLKKTKRCLRPGSMKPRKRCR